MEETQKVSKNALKSKEMEVHDSSSTNGQDAADTSLVASDKEEQPVTDQKAAYRFSGGRTEGMASCCSRVDDYGDVFRYGELVWCLSDVL